MPRVYPNKHHLLPAGAPSCSIQLRLHRGCPTRRLDGLRPADEKGPLLRGKKWLLPTSPYKDSGYIVLFKNWICFPWVFHGFLQRFGSLERMELEGTPRRMRLLSVGPRTWRYGFLMGVHFDLKTTQKGGSAKKQQPQEPIGHSPKQSTTTFNRASQFSLKHHPEEGQAQWAVGSKIHA